MKATLLSIILFFSFNYLFAQRYYPSGIQSRAKISIGIGSSTYQGDLKEDRSLSPTPNAMLSYEYLLNPRFSLRADGLVYHIKGSDANSSSIHMRNRNLSFFSTNFEISSSLILHLFRQLPANYRNRKAINAYALMGFGMSYYNPKATYQFVDYNLRELTTEGVRYGKYTPVIPAGFGLEIKASEKINLALEATYRFTFTDYLDDVSTRYPDMSLLASEAAIALSDRRIEAGTPRSQRGNPSLKDGYALLNIRFIYLLDRVYYQAKDKRKKFRR